MKQIEIDVFCSNVFYYIAMYTKNRINEKISNRRYFKAFFLWKFLIIFFGRRMFTALLENKN